MKEKKSYRPVDNQICWGCTTTNNIVRVLVRDILGGQAHLGVAGGQRVTDLVPGDHTEGVVGPGRHGGFD